MSRKLLNLLIESERLEGEKFRLRNMLEECDRRRDGLVEQVREELHLLRQSGFAVRTLSGQEGDDKCPVLMIDGTVIQVIPDYNRMSGEFPLRRVEFLSLEPEEPF